MTDQSKTVALLTNHLFSKQITSSLLFFIILVKVLILLEETITIHSHLLEALLTWQLQKNGQITGYFSISHLRYAGQ
jgi:hypothetical protein